MFVSYDLICERVYAATALATLNGACGVALLHPDHGKALRIVARDAVAAIAASLPSGLVDGVTFTDEGATVEVSERGRDTELAEGAMLAATATLTLAQVKIASSESPETVVRLAAALPSLAAGVAEALSPRPKAAVIRGRL